MKGIILAGGSGTRLFPTTWIMSKQLLPVYDKPMIFYPLSTLMLAGIKDILIISTPWDLPHYKSIFQNGNDWGLNISYAEQPSPDGLAQAFIIGEEFIGSDNVCLVLGDNIFYGAGLMSTLENTVSFVNENKKAVIFGYYVEDPERYGVAEIDKDYNVLSLEEKPLEPKSNYAVVGLYFYPNEVVEIAKSVKPSKRGELEITAVNQEFLDRDKLKMEVLGRGYAWLDTGTHSSLLEASHFIETIEKRQGLKISCIEEIALRKKMINMDQFVKLIDKYAKSSYADYLRNILKHCE